jgi:hypothetical protein
MSDFKRDKSLGRGGEAGSLNNFFGESTWRGEKKSD